MSSSSSRAGSSGSSAPGVVKFPRTPHIAGSKKQRGDESMRYVLVEELLAACGPDSGDGEVVAGEKLDGSNAGVWFADSSPSGLKLQSRGGVLSGGVREKQFAPMKKWAAEGASALLAALGTRYVLYGEWMHAKHTVYYDALPCWFVALDVWDRERDAFLAEDPKRELVGTAESAGVELAWPPVLLRGRPSGQIELLAALRPPAWRTDEWKPRLRAAARRAGTNPDRAVAEADADPMAEGLYFRAERDGTVQMRAKWVRPTFTSAVLDSGTHWSARPVVPNGLARRQ